MLQQSVSEVGNSFNLAWLVTMVSIIQTDNTLAKWQKGQTMIYTAQKTKDQAIPTPRKQGVNICGLYYTCYN